MDSRLSTTLANSNEAAKPYANMSKGHTEKNAIFKN
jgi:hypothetical protein